MYLCIANDIKTRYLIICKQSLYIVENFALCTKNTMAGCL